MRRAGRAMGLAILALGCLAAPAGAVMEPEKYDLESVSASLSSPQAGAHADLTTTVVLSAENGEPFASTSDVVVKVPPGVIGNPQGIPRCTTAQLGLNIKESECPVASQVGISRVAVAGAVNGTLTEPVYNMVPPKGSDIVARFGLFAGLYPTILNARVDPTDYSIVVTIEGAPSAANLSRAETIFWGVPGDPSHDGDRRTPEEAANGESPPGGRPSGLPPAPFMANPTDCSLQRQITVTATSYQLPDQPKTKSAPFPEIVGCGKLAFKPTFTAIPTNPEAAAPTGLETELIVPQDETPQGRSTSAMKSARVTFPQGMTINPAAGAGLEGCSAEQVGFGVNSAAACPDGSKIGAVEVEVPALEDTLRGAVYQRTPEPGNLFRLWVTADGQGAHLKLPGRIETDPQSGQLTAVFSGLDSLGGLPQVPFSNLKLRAFGGPRAPLVTPPACGTYRTHFSFAPWSGRPAAEGDTPMQIAEGCGKGGFSPRIVAGTLDNGAGRFSPFSFTLTREDGEANPRTIAAHLPQGLVAKLKGVPLCPDAAAATGACPSESRIGALTASAGVGGAPLWVPQPGKAPTAVYLSGPYKGAPYSIVSVVPAQAGPFDLGLVVNRAAIRVDPETALVTIATDPLPQILEGVPIAYRTVNVLVDRPEFMLNPTDCSRKQIAATIVATNGAVAEPTAGFKATDCAKLDYAPKLSLAFTGQTKRTGNPGVKAVLTQKPGQANTAKAIALLPASQFIDQSHINNPCTRVQFAAEACPPKSVLGNLEATSPLFQETFKGKLYFRSNGGERELPDIVADLRGPNGIRVIQVAFVDSVKGRVRTRFLSIPDVPISRAVFTFFAGKRGLIENSQNLCIGKRRAEIHLTAQNDRLRTTKPVIAVKCGGN